MDDPTTSSSAEATPIKNITIESSPNPPTIAIAIAISTASSLAVLSAFHNHILYKQWAIVKDIRLPFL